jgi:hypothetical protein
VTAKDQIQRRCHVNKLVSLVYVIGASTYLKIRTPGLYTLVFKVFELQVVREVVPNLSNYIQVASHFFRDDSELGLVGFVAVRKRECCRR